MTDAHENQTDLMLDILAAKRIGWSYSNMRYHIAQGHIQSNERMVSWSEVEACASQAKVGRRIHTDVRELKYDRKHYSVYLTPRESYKWESFCKTHEISEFFYTKKKAIAALAQPHKWCLECEKGE
jgi:hypothetical protein